MEYKKFIELTKNRNPWIIVYPRISISSPTYKVSFFLHDTGRKNSYNIKVVIIAAKNLDCDIPTVTLPVQTN